MIKLRFPTPAAWTELVVERFDEFLLDHAAAEKKASGMAVSMLSHYPDRPELVKAMTDLAIEELSHFRDVVKIIQSRGLQLGPDGKDPYINGLRKTVRTASEPYLLDRLLVAGVIEARGCERFALVGEGIGEATLQRFYRGIAQSESRHAELFVDLARRYFDETTIAERLEELLAFEAQLVADLPLRPALH